MLLASARSNYMADGQFHNHTRARQLVSFSGMTWGKISPTDLDCVLEFQNRLFIFVELKSSGAPVPQGQRLCLERLASAISQDPSKTAVSIVADHWTPSSEDISCGSCLVREVFTGGQWRPAKEQVTVKRMVDYFHRKCFQTPAPQPPGAP